MSIPENFLKASGIVVLAPGSGGPLTTTLPSALADANSASQADVAEDAPCVALGGALGVAQPTTAPTPTTAIPLSNCRRLTRALFTMCSPSLRLVPKGSDTRGMMHA